jgi:dephospho-CoA kinase
MRKVIGLCGLIGNGKGAVADILIEEGFVELIDI